MVSGNGRGRPALGRWILALGVGGLIAGQAAPTPPATDPRLSATLVGRLEPGSTGRLAVRWDGPDGALLDTWLDLDGDGVRGPKEQVVDRRPLATGIEVVSFDVGGGAQIAAEPGVWVEWRGEARAEEEIVRTDRGRTKDDICSWHPGFSTEELLSEVHAMVVFDDGAGPAL